MFTLLMIRGALGAVLLAYVIELCLAPAQIRRLQYEHADWMSKCLEWSRKGLDPEAQLAARQVEQLRQDIDFLRSMLRPWQRARRLLLSVAGFLFLAGCSGADFEATSGEPAARSTLPQDALAPVLEADAGAILPEGAGGHPGASGGASGIGGDAPACTPPQPGFGSAGRCVTWGGAPGTGGAPGSGDAASGGAGSSGAGSGGAWASTGGAAVQGSGGSASTPAEVLREIGRSDCALDSVTVDCSAWRPTVDVHPVGVRCQTTLPVTLGICHPTGPVGNLWCCVP